MIENQAAARVRELQADINSKELPARARQANDSGRWTRQRAMPLEDMIRCTLAKQGLTGVMELRRYFHETGAEEPAVSKAAYFQQRKKLSPEVFTYLNQNYLRRYYRTDEAVTWHGYVVLAVDGSRAEIPDSAENRKTYGESMNKYGSAVARMNVSTAYDVFSRFILDIGTYHYCSSEIAEAKAHIPAVREITGERAVLYIFDRNYASMEFMDVLEKSGVTYLIRLHSSNYKRERNGMGSGDEAVRLQWNGNRLQQFRKENPGRVEELRRSGHVAARILTMKFKGEEPGALITNLGSECRAEEIRRLYRKRWDIEEKYHTLKNKMKFESVTGRASIYVKQDFWAQTLVFNMLQDLITGAEQKLKREAKKKCYRYEMRINENIAIGLLKEQFVRLMIETNREQQDRMFMRLKKDMMSNIVPVRNLPGSPRRWQYFNKYKCNQKPGF